MDKHTDTNFEKELEIIRSELLLMGGTVIEMIKSSLDGLLTANESSFKTVFELEQEINASEVKIDSLCTNTLAIRQPTAVDLRFIVSSQRMIRDIERIGDEAEKMARMGQFFHKNVHREIPKLDFSATVSDVISMLKRVLDAYARDDASELKTVILDDKAVDDSFRNTLNELISHMLEEHARVSKCIDLIFFAKALERIGDHAKNMSESIIFMVKGDDLRHSKT
ncbi:MAG: phosphate transport system regulatory protein PhoU [Betaproteobacteria bacterium TMED156]|nr:MAG: phosphate transport system regulatory protein PhoU [Betaproteobacteria bacterium TMED156]